MNVQLHLLVLLHVRHPACLPPPQKKLVEFIDFLEKIDRDMTAEVEHVKESIRETREYIEEWQDERSTREAAILKRKEREKRETKLPDSDFWLGV